MSKRGSKRIPVSTENPKVYQSVLLKVLRSTKAKKQLVDTESRILQSRNPRTRSVLATGSWTRFNFSCIWACAVRAVWDQRLSSPVLHVSFRVQVPYLIGDHSNTYLKESKKSAALLSHAFAKSSCAVSALRNYGLKWTTGRPSSGGSCNGLIPTPNMGSQLMQAHAFQKQTPASPDSELLSVIDSNPDHQTHNLLQLTSKAFAKFW